MKDLLLRARVVVRTSNMKISRRPLADYVKTLHQKACSTIISFIQPIKSLICGVVVDACRRQILNSLITHTNANPDATNRWFTLRVSRTFIDAGMKQLARIKLLAVLEPVLVLEAFREIRIPVEYSHNF